MKHNLPLQFSNLSSKKLQNENSGIIEIDEMKKYYTEIIVCVNPYKPISKLL